MKKLIAILSLALLPAAAFAAEGGNHPMAGCGLAYILFAKDAPESKGLQILAGTTNNFYGTQSFGITSGTSGCTESGTMAQNREAEVYADVNFKNIQREMAAGNGEYLSTFASLLGVKEVNRPALFQMLQKDYAAIFPTAGTDAVAMLEAVSRKLAENPKLLG